MSIAELRTLWAEHMGRAKAPVQKRLLMRELAWRIQEREHGGLSTETRRLLNAAVRAAKRASAGATTDVKSGRKRDSLGGSSATRIAAKDLPPSTRLVREWGGVVHEVFVLEAGCGYQYRDKTYGSLSEVARAITGTRWSGPRFFGLTTRAKSELLQSKQHVPATRSRSDDGS